jgi:hypothetical protein
MNNTIREKIAQSICDTWGYIWDGDPNDAQTAPETNEDGYDPRPSKELFRKAADAVLALLPQSPEGWVMVPREPTEAMLEAGHGVRHPSRTVEANTRSTWDAMITASSHSQEGEQNHE